MSKFVVVCNDSAYFLRHRATVCEVLAERGHDVLIMMGGGRLDGLHAGLGYIHVPIERFKFDVVRDFGLFLETWRQLRRQRPVTLHAITLKPALFSGIAVLLHRFTTRQPVRLVVTIPGLGRLMARDSNLRSFGSHISRAAVRAVFRFMASRRNVYFTFETHHDRDFWRSIGIIGDGNSLVTAGAGVDGYLYRPAAAVERRMPLRVLFAARLLRSKGLHAFIEAARMLGPESGAEFLVAGISDAGDPDAIDLDEVRASRSVTFLGEVRQMAPLLRSVDLVCLPTRYGEGVPRILIEAAACGLPAIAADSEGCRQIVTHGRSGTLVPIGSEEEMASALAKAVMDYVRDPELAKRQGGAARAIFEEGGFSSQAVTARFVRLLAAANPL